jgi:protoheme IX farnesyltransferase
VIATSVRPVAWARDVLSLAKPRLSLLVICTTAGGLWLAPGRLEGPRALLTILFTAMVVASANALNCYLERDVDARMRRTRERPLAARRLDPRVALALGLAVPVVAIPGLARAANPLTALLAAIALFVYVCVYTPMKQRSTWALVVGAVPGALPPLIGWTAVTGRLDAGGLLLFAILFLWQLPHFLAISIYLKDDYARGGLKVFSLVHGDDRAKLWAALSSVALVPATLALVPLGLATPPYGAAASLLGAVFCAAGLWGLHPRRGSRWARAFFLASLLYLTLLFAALIAGAR